MFLEIIYYSDQALSELASKLLNEVNFVYGTQGKIAL